MRLEWGHGAPVLMSASMSAQRVSSSVRRVVASACTLGVALRVPPARPCSLATWGAECRTGSVRARSVVDESQVGAVTDRVCVAGRMRPTKTPTLISTLRLLYGHLLWHQRLSDHRKDGW